MTKLFTACLAALTLSAALPAAAQGIAAPPNLTQEELMAWARQSGICGTDPLVDAQYQGTRQAKIVCGEATGFVPVAAAGALGFGGAGFAAAAGGLGLAALAGGGGGGTNSTISTTSTQ